MLFTKFLVGDAEHLPCHCGEQGTYHISENGSDMTGHNLGNDASHYAKECQCGDNKLYECKCLIHSFLLFLLYTEFLSCPFPVCAMAPSPEVQTRVLDYIIGVAIPPTVLPFRRPLLRPDEPFAHQAEQPPTSSHDVCRFPLAERLVVQYHAQYCFVQHISFFLLVIVHV